MSTLYRTTIRDVGSEASDLIDQGIVILFALGAPPELAEISITHEANHEDDTAPADGDTLQIDQISFKITAVGPTAWQKVREIGHVVFYFNGAEVTERPGEICIEAVAPERLRALLRPGVTIEVNTVH
jgi:PTS system glucitol/sorbitol-specific IIA component